MYLLELFFRFFHTLLCALVRALYDIGDRLRIGISDDLDIHVYDVFDRRLSFLPGLVLRIVMYRLVRGLRSHLQDISWWLQRKGYAEMGVIPEEDIPF